MKQKCGWFVAFMSPRFIWRDSKFFRKAINFLPLVWLVCALCNLETPLEMERNLASSSSRDHFLRELSVWDKGCALSNLVLLKTSINESDANNSVRDLNQVWSHLLTAFSIKTTFECMNFFWSLSKKRSILLIPSKYFCRQTWHIQTTLKG